MEKSVCGKTGRFDGAVAHRNNGILLSTAVDNVNQTRNLTSKRSVWSWQKIVLVFLVLGGIVGYQLLRPTLQQRWGVPLPDLFAPGAETNSSAPQTNSPQNTPAQQAPSDSNTSSSSSLRFPPDQIGRQSLTSPGGLRYTMGPGGEHRIDHVLNHAVDDPSRQVHSVFTGDRFQIFAAIDEAFAITQQDNTKARKLTEDGRDVWTVDMRREIGYEGGIRGKRDDYPALRKIRLVLQDNNHVISAYPCR